MIAQVIGVIFFLFFFYQVIYVPIALFARRKRSKPVTEHTFAVLICARNESAVIGDLIDSLHRQNYDPEKLHIFVMADNCTDNTADVARRAGATVYERQNCTLVGKGYALDALLDAVGRDFPDCFEGYLVFDADNVLEENFVSEMNRVFDGGADIVTGYRNSHNFGDNWISAGYGLWFLRESRYLNLPRHLVGSSAMVSGTGFLFSEKVRMEQGGWPFHTLSEDTEFSAYHIVRGKKIAMAPDAILYDEQPTGFRQSWNQRLRWSRGYLQVLGKYGKKLTGGMLRGQFACYDMIMSIAPAAILSILGLVVSVVGFVDHLLGGDVFAAVFSLAFPWVNIYLTLFAVGALTMLSERRRIAIPTGKKIRYCFTFPLFMVTYLPITIVALFARKVTWVPIVHKGSRQQTGKTRRKCREEGQNAF